MFDKIDKIGKSKIQHGKFNNRIYLMKLNSDDLPSIFIELKKLALKNNYEKIFAKVPGKFKNLFLEHNYSVEALIPNYYNGKDDCVFMGLYLNIEREVVKSEIKNRLKDVLKKSKLKQNSCSGMENLNDAELRILNKNNVEELTDLYKEVFESYPFPIHDPTYIKKTMTENINYFGVFEDNKLIAASSAEMDLTSASVEMTDFATDKDYLGKNLSLKLLAAMEKNMTNYNIKTFYTIARGVSYGMNITFAKLGYKYGGTLINNTNISGKIENMNVWHKSFNKKACKETK